METAVEQIFIDGDECPYCGKRIEIKDDELKTKCEHCSRSFVE